MTTTAGAAVGYITDGIRTGAFRAWSAPARNVIVLTVGYC
jgi:hypothetical protein